MRNYFVLDGVDSRTFGLYLNGAGTFDSPSRTVNYIRVPGRDGDLIGMQTRMGNGVYRYLDAFICTNFRANLAAFRAFLLSKTGYRRLTDSYHPEFYRMVAFSGPLRPEVTPTNSAGRFDIELPCKPQRWLLSGEITTTMTEDGTLENPTLFTSAPLLRVYGTGTVGIGARSITIIRADEYTDIDLDTGSAYKDGTNHNDDVSLGLELPTLEPGANGITLGEGITRVDITPRWWSV